MKIFKRKRIFIYIGFIILCISAVGVIAFFKINTNVLLGKWISNDEERIYTFEDKILTIEHVEIGESRIYGYNFKNNNTLILQTDENEYRYFTVRFNGNEMLIASDDSDSPEILRKA